MFTRLESLATSKVSQVSQVSLHNLFSCCVGTNDDRMIDNKKLIDNKSDQNARQLTIAEDLKQTNKASKALGILCNI